MKIVGVIPARYKSSRFEGKPLASICGKPMIWWVYYQVKKVSQLDNVYVATDDVRIANVCNKYNMNVVMTSVHHKTGTDRMGEVANKIGADWYVNVQGDEPLIDPSSIELLISSFIENKNFQVFNTMTKIFSVEDINNDSIVKVVTNRNREGIYLSRSPVPYPKSGESIQYYKHLGLYAISSESMSFFTNTKRGCIEEIEDIEMMRFIENNIPIKFVEVDSENVAVDWPEDILKVEELMKSTK